jgi:site-specific recombinase XerD
MAKLSPSRRGYGARHRALRERCRALVEAGLVSCARCEEIHELRHSAADELWRLTGNIVLAQQLLCHENVSTTQAYLHPSREDLREGMRLLDRA